MKSLLPNNVYAGTNATKNLIEIFNKEEISNLLVFTGKIITKSGLVDYFLDFVPDSIKVKVINNIAVEPSYQEVQSAIDDVANFKPDMVVGLGGGSVIDSAKLFSIIYESGYQVKDLLDGEKIKKRTISSLMIPTTCGTGAEATINSIVAIPEKNVKMGIVSDEMMPDYVILDPHYIEGLPKHTLAASAVDAFCHGIECFTSNKANLISDIYAKACCELILNNLEIAYLNEIDEDSRLSLLIGAYFGGLAITSSGTTAVHALSYPLGGKFKIPHGVSNAILLADVMQLNKEYILPELSELSAYLFSSKINMLNMKDLEKADYLLNQMNKMIEVVDIPLNLNQWNVTVDDIDFLTNSAMEQKRLLNNNKKELTHDEVRSVYIKVIGGSEE